MDGVSGIEASGDNLRFQAPVELGDGVIRWFLRDRRRGQDDDSP